MLCQFTVKNFQCLKDEVTFDLQAANISEHSESLIVDEDGESFLPLGVIYGPNGSGKSTVLKALFSLAAKVMRPICAAACDNKECAKLSGSSEIKPFLFSETSLNTPTEFEIFFRTGKNEYQYKLAVLKSKIVNEELYKKLISGKKYIPIFTRKGNTDIQLFYSLKSFSCSGISDNLPLLSFLGITHRRNYIIKEIVNWFDSEIDFVNYNNPIDEYNIPVAESGKLKDLVLKMLKEMDIDIVDYRTRKEKEKINIDTYHFVNGKKYSLDFFEESSGSIKVFGMLPKLANCLLSGKTLVIDELDAKIHPVLLKYIINLFRDKSVNKFGAQLIFTSHDLSTMNSDTFRRDEIWFIAKGSNDASQLYSLVEFKTEDGKSVRKDARYDKQYLEGHYGADPYLQRIIDWGEQ